MHKVLSLRGAVFAFFPVNIICVESIKASDSVLSHMVVWEEVHGRFENTLLITITVLLSMLELTSP